MPTRTVGLRQNGAVSLYRDDAVVLRTQKLGEADRIITVLTRRNGRVRAVAKGIRRTSSKFGARLEPANHVDVQLYLGRSLDIVTQAEIRDPFGDRLRHDYESYTLGTAMLETAEKLTAEEREPAIRLYLLLLGALRALTEQRHDARLIFDAFVLRALATSGYQPALDDCARCGAQGPHRWFSVPAGGLVCGDCRPPGSVAPASATIALLRALLTGEWAAADASAPEFRHEASGLVAAYLQWHLEHGIRSLRLLEPA
jgi:DNA repair protein RecO (recombination protein O)|nr:DNA repair protein RecO [Acidothermus cellulolyticus]